MRPAPSSLARLAAFVIALASSHAAIAGSAPAPSVDRRAGASFTLLVTQTTTAVPTPMPSNGVGLPPAKPTVTNPYHVPLLQNAGSFGAVR